jgi:hypothetical protein
MHRIHYYSLTYDRHHHPSPFKTKKIFFDKEHRPAITSRRRHKPISFDNCVTHTTTTTTTISPLLFFLSIHHEVFRRCCLGRRGRLCLSVECICASVTPVEGTSRQCKTDCLFVQFRSQVDHCRCHRDVWVSAASCLTQVMRWSFFDLPTMIRCTDLQATSAVSWIWSSIRSTRTETSSCEN